METGGTAAVTTPHRLLAGGDDQCADQERKDFFRKVPQALKTNLIDKFSPTTFDIDVYVYMNYKNDTILEEINNRLSNRNMTIGARWFHEMTMAFWLPSFFLELSRFRHFYHISSHTPMCRRISAKKRGGSQ